LKKSLKVKMTERYTVGAVAPGGGGKGVIEEKTNQKRKDGHVQD